MREKIIGAIIAVFFSSLLLGLFYMQVIRHGYYSRLSKNNSIRIIPIDGPRGNIFDRKGIPLVTNRISFNISIIYQELKNKKALAGLLKETLGLSGPEISSSFEKASLKPFAPVTIAEDIGKEKAIVLEEATLDTDGLLIETRSKRNYLYNTAGSHVFGYLGEVSEEDLELLKIYGYHAKDLIGVNGVEKYYDTYLKGVDGGTQVEVDNRGRQMRVLGLKEPSSGKDLYLTIDLGLQLACDKLLGGHKGAVVVMDPKTGEVLALASHPAFDPNIFVRPKTTIERLRLLRDKEGRPLSDRAISGLYAPGSVFKIVTASAALDMGRITPNTRFFCPGSYKLGNAKFDCWKEEGHGPENIREGLMNSCNVFFYNTGRAAGVDYMEAYTKLFGFGKLTGIDLPDEVRGIVPGRIWKRIHRQDNWYEGETLNYAIGQGYLLVTPVQVLDMMAVMANKGSLVRPYIVKRIGDTDVSPTRQKYLGLKDETIRTIREGLYSVVNSENGTGKRAKLEGVLIAGKTGTAQNPQGPTHAWFTGYGPTSDPKICLVVFLEHGGKGGLSATEIAHGIFEEAHLKGYL